jgi:hypothetical protein
MLFLIMGQTILFIVFVIFAGIGAKLIWYRSGNHDVDFITKLIGWIIFIPALLGIIDSLTF